MYDLIVIGGGIVGLATAQRYLAAHPGREALLLEKEPRLCPHQSGRNSGVLHSGIYYAPGSRRARLCLSGKASLEKFCREAGVPFVVRGKLIVASTPSELPRLQELERRGKLNGVRLERLDARGLRKLEPAVGGVAGLHVPETGVVDFARVGDALAARFVGDGGQLRLGAQVRAVHSDSPGAQVVLADEVLSARRVVVCAGAQADRLAGRAGLAGGLRVVPFRGEYLRLREPHAEAVRGLVYPVPDPRLPFLGVHFTRRVDGTVEAGPNAVPACSREGRARWGFSARDTLDSLAWPGSWRLAAKHLRAGAAELHRSLSKERFAREARRLLPTLRTEWLERAPAGTRAQVVDRRGNLVEDFTSVRDGSVLHLLNAPSPAATASLAIADSLLEELEQEGRGSSGSS